MTFHKQYLNQVKLLLDVLPFINEFKCFALKGGTAINLFIQDMPRLSVDIDLQYLPIEPRSDFLSNIRSVLEELKEIIERKSGFKVIRNAIGSENFIKMNVMNDEAIIKIEPNFVQRGSVYSAELKTLVDKAQDEFLVERKVQCLSTYDIYGGKLVAAFDRQHPRDLFDVKLMLETQGINDALRKAFIVYLASSPRPMHELLLPNNLNLQDLFNNEFKGMLEVEVSLDELISAKNTALKEIKHTLTDNEKSFLLSLKSGKPYYGFLGIAGVDLLPALQWKTININKMNEKKKTEMLRKLEHALEV